MDNDFIIKSIVNRVSYLKRRKAECDDCKTDGKRFKIIIELIQLEPSHLLEPWILEAVILWQSNFHKYQEYLKDAFAAKGARTVKTEKQELDLARNSFIFAKVQKMLQDNNFEHRTSAIKKFIEEADLSSNCDVKSFDENLRDFDKEVEAIEQRLNRFEKRKDTQLPFPYFGRDIIKSKNGIKFIFRERRVDLGQKTLFGTWIYERAYSPEMSSAFDEMVADITRQVMTS